jgi:hypothetical protein
LSWNICSRMNGKNTQINFSPSVSLLEDNENESNIDQLLFAGIATRNQIAVPLTLVNMFPSQNYSTLNVQQNVNLTRRQQGRRRRRRRQQQHQRRRGHQEAMRQQNQSRQQQQQEPRVQRPQVSDRAFQSSLDCHYEYHRRRDACFIDTWNESDHFEEPVDEIFNTMKLNNCEELMKSYS